MCNSMKKRCTAIVLAAGQGKRMGTKTQKQYLDLCGYPVLWHCLHTFEESAVIDDMILVTGEDQIDYCRTEFVEKYGFRKICKIVAGGAERYHSVLNGLRAMEKNACEDGYVFIHDGARPFVDEPMLERVYADVCKYEACVVGMPVKDTIKIADTDGFIKETPKRSLVWQIQTPQVFSRRDFIFLRTIRLLKRFSEILKEPMGFGTSFRGFLPTGPRKK